MFELLLTTCLAGTICTQAQLPATYEDAAACFDGAAAIAEKIAGPTGMPYAYRADCGTVLTFGKEYAGAVISTAVSMGADLPEDFAIESVAQVQ